MGIERPGAVGERIARATGRCVARWGLARTSIEDIAEAAAVSRATVYRLFPGGKRALVEQAAQVEVRRFFERFTSRLDAAADVETWLRVGLAEAVTALGEDAAVGALLLATIDTDAPGDPFGGLGHVVQLVSEAATPYASRFVGEAAARKVAEWLARAALSYTTCPSPDYDLRRAESIQALVSDFLLPSVAPYIDDHRRDRSPEAETPSSRPAKGAVR